MELVLFEAEVVNPKVNLFFYFKTLL